MSAWLVALGLGAGYLVNKNMIFRTQLENSVSEYQNAAEPATGGVTSAEVRKAHKRIDHVLYGDYNAELPRKDVDAISKQQASAASAVQQFDSEQPSVIQGVLLHYDHLGV